MRQIRGRTVNAHALTHAHPDHQGSSHAICERLRSRCGAGSDDVPAMETPGGDLQQPGAGLAEQLSGALLDRAAAPGRARAERGRRGRRLQVLEAPGHSPGHVAYWRESDRVLILGDVLNNMNLIDRHPRAAGAADGVHARPGAQPPVRAQARGAASPSSSCFGHGPPLRDPRQLARVHRRAARLSAEIDGRAASSSPTASASCRPSRRAGRGTRARCTAARRPR